LYAPAISRLKLPHVIAEWHRYVIDLNRLPEDVDAESVRGHANPPGSFTTGLLWVKTTTGVRLMREPIAKELHRQLLEKYFFPFHARIEENYARFRQAGAKQIFHIDCHSMPSWGTGAHRDPGQHRAEIVISDFNGKSCRPDFKELVVEAYDKAGFQTALNWPYVGGRLTQQYGKPARNQHAIQVELRRDLYMDEKSKKLVPQAEEVKQRLLKALTHVVQNLDALADA
jgi:N-formylglutamate deformylase